MITISAALLSFYLLALSLEFFLGFNLLKNLSAQIVLPREQLPSVSIIVSALNEEKSIQAALTSMLQQNYADFEVIVLNDRSTDKTPEMIEALAKQFSNLKVKHITTLPENWLGKNHALNLGSSLAKGEWLLFTDADTMMKPDTLSKSLSYALENDLDHLTIYENHVRKTFWLKVLMLGSYLGYSIHYKPWRARFSWSKKSLGHGAFNLVKKSVYQHCGGHKSIAHECLDDMKLGALLKNNGYKQDTVNGKDYVEREWYDSLPNMIAGFKKNAFAIYDYRFLPMFCYSFLTILFIVLPFFGVFFSSGLTFWLSVINIGLMLALSAYIAAQFRLPKRFALLYPFSMLLLLYTLWNSAFSVFSNAGIEWRGTHYPLQALRGKKS